MLENDYGLPVANLGLHAGMGPEACVGFGFAALRKGDIMILSLEPTMISEQIDSKAMGTRFAYGLGKPELLDWQGVRSPLDSVSSFFQLQPGGYHVVTMLGKLALGQPLYRYSVDEMRPGGLQITSERRALMSFAKESAAPEQCQLSADARRFLERIKAQAERRGINVAYLLPWSYAPTASSNALRAANRELLEEINKIIPVLYDSEFGIHTAQDDFADTGQHLTREAAAKRSMHLVPLLQQMQKPVN
jgi:hypothetical protein